MPLYETIHTEKGAEQDIDHAEIISCQKAVDIDSAVAELSASHKAYLLERHGTLNLDPLPSESPADPYNWPRWTVSTCSPIRKTFEVLTD